VLMLNPLVSTEAGEGKPSSFPAGGSTVRWPRDEEET
jgi:hypothetical protein